MVFGMDLTIELSSDATTTVVCTVSSTQADRKGVKIILDISAQYLQNVVLQMFTRMGIPTSQESLPVPSPEEEAKMRQADAIVNSAI
jgi:hypothetical protein